MGLLHYTIKFEKNPSGNKKAAGILVGRLLKRTFVNLYVECGSLLWAAFLTPSSDSYVAIFTLKILQWKLASVNQILSKKETQLYDKYIHI